MSENNPIDLEAIRAENKIAQETLSHLCHEKWAGRDGWHWEIPANPMRDTDLQLNASIQSSNKLCDEVESLRQRVRELEGDLLLSNRRAEIALDEYARLKDKSDALTHPPVEAKPQGEARNVIEFPSSPAYNIDNRPLTWLYTHCIAIGMTSKSNPPEGTPTAELDIALFTADLLARAEKAESVAHPIEGKGSMEAVPSDSDLHQFGYAPGNYTSKCHRCDSHYHDLDKRAICCRTCAIEAFKAARVQPPTMEGKGSAGDQAFALLKELQSQAQKCIESGTDIGANYVRAWLGNIIRHLEAARVPPDAQPNQSAIIAFCPTHGLVSPCGACNLKNPLPIPEDMQSKQEDPLREILSPEMKEYRNLFFSAEASFRNGYMCGVSDMEIVSLGNKPPGEDERLKVFLSSLKSWEPAPEDMQSKAGDPLYDKSAEFRAGYLWGIGAAADHIVDLRDMIPKAAPQGDERGG